MTDFSERYTHLEKKFNEQAAKDKSVYLPNIRPLGRVDFVLIASEPSLRRWATSVPDAHVHIKQGFRNFSSSIETSILHFCIRNYLCLPGQTYYLTDLSKGAMLGDQAGRGRLKRYRAWYPLLLDELRLVAKLPWTVFAVGRQVERFLKAQEEPEAVKVAATLLHYSPQAAGHRSKCIQGKEDQFELLAASLRLEQIVEAARAVLVESGSPAPLMKETLSRLNRAELTPSRKALVFCYKTTFETWRQRQSTL